MLRALKLALENFNVKQWRLKRHDILYHPVISRALTCFEAATKFCEESMSKLQESSAQGQMSRSRACSSLRRRNCPALMPFHFAGKHQEKVILWPMVDLEPVFSCFVDAQGKQAQQDSCTHSTQESIVSAWNWTFSAPKRVDRLGRNANV